MTPILKNGMFLSKKQLSRIKKKRESKVEWWAVRDSHTPIMPGDPYSPDIMAAEPHKRPDFARHFRLAC